MCEAKRGQGGVSNYGEADCKDRHTRLCVSARVGVSEQQKRCIWTQTESPKKGLHTKEDSQPIESSLAECE